MPPKAETVRILGDDETRKLYDDVHKAEADIERYTRHPKLDKKGQLNEKAQEELKTAQQKLTKSQDSIDAKLNKIRADFEHKGAKVTNEDIVRFILQNGAMKTADEMFWVSYGQGNAFVLPISLVPSNVKDSVVEKAMSNTLATDLGQDGIKKIQNIYELKLLGMGEDRLYTETDSTKFTKKGNHKAVIRAANIAAITTTAPTATTTAPTTTTTAPTDQDSKVSE